MQLRDDLKRNLDAVYHSVFRLNTNIRVIAGTEQKFMMNPSIAAAEEFQKLDSSTIEAYKDSLENVSKAIACIEALMKQTNGQMEEYILTKSEVEMRLKNFFLGRIKTKPHPLLDHHGCFPWKASVFRPNQFICARSGGRYILMIIEKWENGICTAYDPTDSSGGIRLQQLADGEWTPLPVILPNSPNARWELHLGTTALSLMVEPGKLSGWSCEFHKAVVVSRPCDGMAEGEERGYMLNFGTEENPVMMRIPEQFVVAFPAAWQR